MTNAAKWNLQKGIVEDYRNEYTRYDIQNPLDAYIIAKRKNRLIINADNYNQFIDAAGDQIAAAACKKIDNLLESLK